jgi:hypothetical protein
MKVIKTRVNKKSIIRWKVYFDRSRMYIGYIQFFLIGIVFLESFKDRPWGEFIFRYALIAIPLALFLFILLSLVLGYFDSRLGLREEELRNLSSSNPVLMEIMHSLNEIQSELKNLPVKNRK